jgi:hypothetical protein
MSKNQGYECLKIVVRANGYEVFLDNMQHDYRGATFVFESFDNMVAWLKDNLEVPDVRSPNTLGRGVRLTPP